MDVMQLRISGRWAQFRKPETNNNPLTHDFITKTALIGLMGAVLGKERQPQMRELFPILCDDLLYGVRVNGVVKKESWGFTLRGASSYHRIWETRNSADLRSSRAPKQMEFLRDPDFTVVIALHNERSRTFFEEFGQSLREGEARFTPVLGLHNCPAEIEWIGAYQGEAQSGVYNTQGFVRRDHEPQWQTDLSELRIGYDKVPSFQNDDWWNLPDRYVSVAYPSNGTTLSGTGQHIRVSNGESWCLI